eukprot:CAMPEP_0177655240 /NCGR_PEP_ID=MMETSP0447-20121125/14839_1 /TAXON_ID=0 /ORGANISM="Stygamoeba regulata, Strain BSH-02190019" /LENGTH=405 /DNA_ID=CAMNT_0019159101 /DNA_START=22 /DNA_END=1239 /DNA_ORIENTATION=+
MSQETSASFVGVFSLRTPEQVAEMVTAVRGVVEKSAKLFFVITTEEYAPQSLMNDLNTIVRLSSDFPNLCKDETVKLRSQEIVQSMSTSRLALEGVLSGRKPLVPLNEHEAKVISEEVASILEQTAYLSEQMEIEQNKRVLTTVKTGFECLKLVKGIESDFGLEQKLGNVDQVFTTLIRCIANRADVTDECALKTRLEAATATLRAECPNLCRLTREYIMSGKEQGVGARQVDCMKTLAGTIKDLTDLLQDPASRLAARCNFEYKKIAEGLDALAEAVKQNHTATATEKAKAIVDEVNRLQAEAGSAANDADADSDAKRALLNSSERLKNMTARLLNATKTKLANPEDSAASKDFDSAVKDMKQEAVSVVQLKAPKKSGCSTKETLLSASKKLTSGMQQMDKSLV